MLTIIAVYFVQQVVLKATKPYVWTRTEYEDSISSENLVFPFENNTLHAGISFQYQGIDWHEKLDPSIGRFEMSYDNGEVVWPLNECFPKEGEP